jgi:apolipoprotein N-acyltransferase
MTNSAVSSQQPDAAVYRRPGEPPPQRWRRLLQGKLLRQVTLPALIGLIQLGLALVEMVRTPVTPASLLWLLVSFVIGFGFGSAIRVVWDDDAVQVVLVGGQVLLTLAFVMVNVGSKAVLKHALDDLTSAGVIVLLVGSGLLLGHALGLGHQIRGVLSRASDARMRGEPDTGGVEGRT